MLTSASAHTDHKSDLLQSHISGDRSAFAELEKVWGVRLRAYFRRQAGFSPEVAEELTQEVFIRLLGLTESYRAQGALDSYILKVARNIVIDQRRRIECRVPTVSHYCENGDEEMEEAVNILGGARLPPPDEVANFNDQLLRVRTAMGRLPDIYRVVVELGIIQHLPYADVGRRLGIPVGTVKSRIHTAVRLLKAVICETESASLPHSKDSPILPRCAPLMAS